MAADAGGLTIALLHPHIGFLHGAFVDDALGGALVLATEAGMATAVQGYIESRRRTLRSDLVTEAHEIANKLYGIRLRGIARRTLERAGALGVDLQLVKRLTTNIEKLHEAVGYRIS